MPEKKSEKEAKQVLLTIKDVSNIIGISRQTVYNLIYREGLPSIHVRGIRRVHPDSLNDWLKEREK